ncbi:MAG TPA: hypothetical protein DDY91_11475 [Planctomycetaceae bacterium]|nr:hypothetical protein [Planctomycetaceae bacterium]
MRKFTLPERARRIVSSIVVGLALTAIIFSSRVCFASQIDTQAEVQCTKAAPGNPPAPAAPKVVVLHDRPIAKGVVVQVVKDLPVTLPGNPIADESRPNPAKSEQGRKLLEKLRKSIKTRINNVSLNDAQENTAEEHDFRDRFDLEGGEHATIDPERTRVGINLPRRSHAEVLREILASLNLPLAIDDGEVLNTNHTRQPGEVKRKTTADNAPIEQLVLGNSVVSDKNEEAEANKAPLASSRAVVQLERNDTALKEMMDRERAYFRKQFQMSLRTELALSLRACRPNPEQRTEIRRAAEKAFEESLEKMVDIFVQKKRGWNGPPPKSPNIKEEVQQAITETVNRLLPADAAAAYTREVDARNEHRKKTTIQNLVSVVDRSVILSTEQRQKLTAQMTKHWSPDWGNALEYLQWVDNIFPNMPAECLDSVLTDNQKKVWAEVKNMDRSEFWGVGFGYFNAQFLLDGEGVGVNVGVAEQFTGDVQSGVAAEGAIAPPADGEARPLEAKPGAENAAPEKPLPETPGQEKPGDG